MKLNQYIDHTLLSAFATEKDILQLCEEALEHEFFSVCVNSDYVALAAKRLKGSKVKVCAVVGFPLGQMHTAAKVFEAQQAVRMGAQEIDMVMNVGLLKSGKPEEVYHEILAVKQGCGDALLKVILETCYLTDDEIREACQLAVEAGADFVKTSTGFGTGGATFEHVALMKETVKDKAKIKASGGIKNSEMAQEYIAMGVDRLGTSSGVKLVSGEVNADSSY